MTYTLRFLVKAPPEWSITGIDTPFEMSLGDKRATFESQDKNMIVRIVGFATESDAEAFVPRFRAALWNVALVRNAPLILEHERGSITFANNPIQAGKNLASSFSLADDSPVHGLGNSGGYTVFRTG
ncbi:hypothetical protein RBH89_18415 [Paracidovorax avenae]